jgi:hypothetical protein
MSKFDEMRSAALAANRDWRAYEERCGRFMCTLVNGFIEYCGIPASNITFLRWDDGEQRYSESDDDMKYTFSGALRFDEKDRCWRFGISIILTQGHLVAFGVTLTESEDGKFMIKAAGDKSSREIEINDSTRCYELYDEIISKIIASYQTRNPGLERIIGFNP